MVKIVSKKLITFALASCITLNTLVLPISALSSNQNNDMLANAPSSEAFSDDSLSERATAVVNKNVSDTPVTFNVEVSADGMYTVGLSYKALGNAIAAIELGIMIDGKYPFAEAEKLSFPRMWQDEEETRVDGLGNEFAAKQIPYNGYRFSLALDVTKQTAQPYMVSLTAGVHEVTIIPVKGSFQLEYFEFGDTQSPNAYTVPNDSSDIYSGDPIIIEGENAYLKNSYWLSGKSDNTNINLTPNSAVNSLVNYIGGSNWKTSGETIVWQTPELEEGYYQLGFSFRQNMVLGGKTYRALTIDGESPFLEANAIGFAYDDDWQQGFFSDKNEVPYLIYLTAGIHEIGLTVVPGETEDVNELLNTAVSALGTLYVEMSMITGETVDIYRDYDLFSQIPDMKERLELILKTLNAADTRLTEITGKNSGSQSSVIKNAARVIGQMIDNRYTAHRYISEYYTRYTALAATLSDMKNMPLDIDKLSLTASNEQNPFEKKSFLKQVSYSIQRFITSFYQDYNNISGTSEDSEPVTVWVNWGRDQAQVLNSLVQSSFTAKTNIPVNIQLVNASIVQANLSGKGPDVILQHSRSEPVNLAMRGVLYDLTEFDDLDEVLSRFQTSAETPYRYKDGLYALPDTQVFYLMYYRKDIFGQLKLTVPETWDDFSEIVKLLARRNLQAWMPNNVATDLTQVNAGIGSINMFPTLLMQKGLDIYSADGRSTNLCTAEVMVAFSEWTDYYTKLKMPKTLDFYNRFRVGTCPIGISNYTTYTTLKAAAPEIDGLWSVAPVPGTKQSDGTISSISSGGGTACAILKKAKNPDDAWIFLKWWTDAETQLAYSNEVEALLGPAGRVAVSNIEAFKGLDWDNEMLQSILKAWDQVREIPEYPGSYYVSRSIYQSFWKVVSDGQNPKDMLLKYGKQSDQEIERKWKQYENRHQ